MRPVSAKHQTYKVSVHSSSSNGTERTENPKPELQPISPSSSPVTAGHNRGTSPPHRWQEPAQCSAGPSARLHLTAKSSRSSPAEHPAVRRSSPESAAVS